MRGALDDKTKLAFENFQAGRVEAAEALFREAVDEDSENADALWGLGVISYQRGDLSNAEAFVRLSIKLRDGRPLCHHLLGVLLQDKDDPKRAAASFRRAVELDPSLVDAHVGLGGALYQLGERTDAEACFRRALELDPNDAKAHGSLGVALTARCLPEEALLSLDRAAELLPDDADAHWNRALALLLSGNLEEGWREYEWRHKRPDGTPTKFPKPRWAGEYLDGRTILLHAEQGLGDAILFCRYVPRVAERGGPVLFGVKPPLKRLMSQLEGVSVLGDGDPLPPYDVHCPLLSLPGLFRTRLETIPAEIPYLSAEPYAAQAFRQRIGQDESLKVGLVWAGNPRLPNDHNRSIPLEAFRGLMESGARLFSLQTDKRPGDEDLLASSGDIIDLAPHLDDFADTAVAIEALDLVISADTSVAHLAGALGRPVWLLLPFAPDWRWLLHRGDSPWYPTMRLFRQTEAQSWPEVIAAVAEALGRLGTR